MMMKNLKTKYLVLIASVVLIGCEKALEPKIDNTYGDEFTWSLPDKAQGVLINAYGNISNTFLSYGGSNFLDVATDNAVTNDYPSAMYSLGGGALTPQNNPVGNWTTAYNQFRNIHLFLENGLTSKVRYNITDPVADVAMKKRLKGEAFFLRAWWGFQLLQQYGGKTAAGEALGYPITLRTVSDGENLDIKRNTYEDCVAQILADCDTAIALLPKLYTGNDAISGVNGLGRGDQQISAALKSRVSLYAASPAYQSDNVVTINAMGQFTVTNSAAYLEKWKKAATLAQEAITLIGNFTTLTAANFNAATTPAEFIWRKFTNNNQMETFNYTPRYYGLAFTGPSQNLIESFPMKSGYPISDSRSNYNEQNPYGNRDPRLDLNVYYNGSVFQSTAIEVFKGGKDSKEAYAQATRTGYYLKKWLAPSAGTLENPVGTYHYCVLFRRTELFLNLAEASNEAYGPTVIAPGATLSAAQIIKNIRTAAGLTAVTANAYVDEQAALGKDAFRKLIQNERRLELAFENQRFFDMRRCLLPLNEPIKGVEIVKAETGTLNYHTVEVEKRRFNELKYYYLPLPYSEIVKSPGIKQNLGW